MGSYAGCNNDSGPKQIDQIETLRNQKRSAALGRPAMKLLGTSTTLRPTNPRPYFCFGSLDTKLFGYLRNIEIKIKSEIKQT